MPLRGLPGSLVGTKWLLKQRLGQDNSGCLFLMLAAQLVVQPVPRVTLCAGFSLAVLLVRLSLTPVRRNVEQSQSCHSHCLQSLLAENVPKPEEVAAQQYDYCQFLSCPPLQGR